MAQGEDQHKTEAAPPSAPRSGTRVVLALLAGIVLGAVGMRWVPAQHEPPRAEEAPATSAPKPGLFHCPMHPAITSDHPGDCPICGMKLVAVDPEETEAKAPPVPGMAAVAIDPTRQQLIGLRTARAREGALAGTWRTVGRIEVAPTRVRKTNVKVDGFVERIFVDFVGQGVRKGQPLFSIYSPSLLAAQQEYLLALQTRDAAARAGGGAEANDGLVEAARRRLELWDVPEGEIERLAQTREASKTLAVTSPIAGVVTAKNIVQGARVTPGEAPYEITDLGEVWVMADVYESDLPRVHAGMKATLALASYPGRAFSGRVAFVDPLLDPNTRTLKAHLHFANPKRELKPGMFGEVVLEGSARNALLIPGDAVIHAGGEDVVFVAGPAGVFSPRVVVIGGKSGDDVEVKSGLGDGEAVVTRANFLLDSESRLRASLAAAGAK